MEASSADGPPALPMDVLVVEDDPIIALGLEDTILGFGVKRVRIAMNVAKAIETIASGAPDFALLDIGLAGENSLFVAETLAALNIPFAFITGYGADVSLPPAFADRPRLPKPCPIEDLEAVLAAQR